MNEAPSHELPAIGTIWSWVNPIPLYNPTFQVVAHGPLQRINGFRYAGQFLVSDSTPFDFRTIYEDGHNGYWQLERWLMYIALVKIKPAHLVHNERKR